MTVGESEYSVSPNILQLILTIHRYIVGVFKHCPEETPWDGTGSNRGIGVTSVKPVSGPLRVREVSAKKNCPKGRPTQSAKDCPPERGQQDNVYKAYNGRMLLPLTLQIRISNKLGFFV